MTNKVDKAMRECETANADGAGRPANENNSDVAAEADQVSKAGRDG